LVTFLADFRVKEVDIRNLQLDPDLCHKSAEVGMKKKGVSGTAPSKHHALLFKQHNYLGRAPV